MKSWICVLIILGSFIGIFVGLNANKLIKPEDTFVQQTSPNIPLGISNNSLDTSSLSIANDNEELIRIINDGESVWDGNITYWNITLNKKCKQYDCDDICFTCEVK